MIDRDCKEKRKHWNKIRKDDKVQQAYSGAWQAKQWKKLLSERQAYSSVFLPFIMLENAFANKMDIAWQQ